MLLFLAAALLLSTLAQSARAQAPPPTPLLPGFLAAVPGLYAANADLSPPADVADAAACAALCTSTPGCVSFNICAEAGAAVRCGVQGWSEAYVPGASAGCAYYRRSLPRNDGRAVQAIPWSLQVPTAGVALAGGPIATAFAGNLDYLRVRDPLDMLYWFAQRAGVVNASGQCFGWGGWIKGSEAGNFLMGAGNAIRWAPAESALRAAAAQVVAGIAGYAQPNGWAWAFNESDITLDNLPDYCASWVVRGLLDAHGAGLPGALDTARATVSLFNNHSQLPFMLPPNGGPNPVQPFPSGFNNVTDGGYGQASGHMIYIEYQGMIKHTLMALSEVGTQADVDIIEQHYQEDWWLQAMLAGDAYHAIWHRQFFSHNYEITAFEAFLDMYVLTGNTTYRDAVLSAWRMLRESWILPGGSFALNEGSYYPPKSYYIGFTGTHVAAAHSHSHGSSAAAAAAADDPYFHSKCMFQPGAEEPPAAHVSPLAALKAAGAALPAPPLGGPNDGDPPTGELCGSVFWTKLNQRFHRLYPENETFVAEMERSILNVGLAALGFPGSGGQGPAGIGIRYFANQHKSKQLPSMHASCCEGQGTRLFGSLPEYLFTYAYDFGGAPLALYVDIYAQSNITLPYPAAGSPGVATLAVDTAWPYGAAVALTLTLPAAGALDLALRVPAWLAAPSMAVTVNGAPAGAGAPGSYLHLAGPWRAGANQIAFALPMALASARYEGASQLPPYERWSALYGPVLLAFTGPWNASVDGLTLLAPAVQPAQPAAWLQPAADGNALHFEAPSMPGVAALPYFEVQEEGQLFTVYPCFVAE